MSVKKNYKKYGSRFVHHSLYVNMDVKKLIWGRVTQALQSDTEDMPPFSLVGYINDVADTMWNKGMVRGREFDAFILIFFQ